MGWNRVRSSGRRLAGSVAAALVLSGLASRGAWGQTFVSIQNGYVSASVGVKEQLNSVNVAGRFGASTVGANSGVLLQLPRSNDLKLLGSYVTVRIDGGTPATPKGIDLIFGDKGVGSETGSEWVTEPTLDSKGGIYAVWHSLPGSDTAAVIPTIEVQLRMSLVHDLVRYEFRVINKDLMASHTVGLRFLQDFATAGSVEAPVVTPTQPGIYHEADLYSILVPASWRVAPANAASTVGGVLQPYSATSAITRPSRIVFGSTKNLCVPLWDYTADSSVRFDGVTGDGAAALYSPEVNLGAGGGSFTFVTYFGKNSGSYDFAPYLAAGVDSVRSLSYDPAAAAGKQLTPNPFTATAFVKNLNDISVSNVQATITLPAGLSLAAGQTARQVLSSVAAGSEGQFNWDVVPTGTVSGKLTYFVSFTADPGGQSANVSRDIDIPALPTQSMGKGLALVSFPYAFADATPNIALGLSPIQFDILRYNIAAQTYETVQALQPGQGYWLRLADALKVSLVGATPVNTASGQVELKLKKGWNLIGNPYLLPVRWGEVSVLNADINDPDYLKALTVEEAAGAGRQWVGSVLFRYDQATGSYAFDQDFSTSLLPYAGYWLNVLRENISIIVPVPSGRSVRIAGTRSGASVSWRLPVVVTSGRSSDSCTVIGVGEATTRSSAPLSFAKPPAPQGGVSAAIVRDGVALAQDLRSPSALRNEWALVISGTPGSEVTMSWPQVASVAKSVSLTAVDPTTSQRYAMRQVGSVRVRLDESGSHRMVVVGEPVRANGVYRFTSWSSVASRSKSAATVSVSGTQDAAVTVRVLGAAGTVVRAIATRTASGGSVASITWDYKDNRGVAVPAGSYAIEVRGTTADGQTARVVIPHVVTR